MRQFKRTAISGAVLQVVLLGAGAVHAQSSDGSSELGPVTVTGQRAALQSAQKIKQNAEEIVDSVVAEEAGKLPDKSITEVLQRVVGVTMNRNRSRGDPEHFSVEGGGIAVRGLTWGASNLNGREMFSAGWPGRELSWSDVPPELMAGVDVYKNPSADRIEGGVSGLVDLRTWLPFDFKGTKGFLTLKGNYAELGKKFSPGTSGLFTTQWDAESGRWGALVDLAYNRSTFLNQSLQVGAFFPHTNVAGQTGTVYAPESASWRSNTGETERSGLYGALQWKKNDMSSSLTYFASATRTHDTESAFGSANEDPYKNVITNGVFDSRGVFQSGTLSMPSGGKGANNYADGGIQFFTNRAFSETSSKTGELAWNFKWKVNDRWSVANDLQWVHSTYDSTSANVYLHTFVPSMNVDLGGGGPVRISFDDEARARLADPANYFWDSSFAMKNKAKADLVAWKVDGIFRFDDPVLRDFHFGTRLTRRKSEHQDAGGNGWNSMSYAWEVKQTSTPGSLPVAADDQGWQSRGTFGYLGDPRYAALAPVEVRNFGNFYGGKVGQLPNVVFPAASVAKDYPGGYKALTEQVAYLQCVDAATNPATQSYGGTVANCNSADWKKNHTFVPLAYDDDPKNIGNHSEDTQALYGTLRFGFDDWKMPVEGNLGVRVVHSKAVAHGYEVFQTEYNGQTPPDLPRFAAFARPIDKDHSYTKTLPTLNLKADLMGNSLIGRVALGQSIYRPGFGDLAEYVTLNQKYDANNNTVSYTGENKGNVKLKPITSNNADLSLEWYPQPGQSLTAAVFHKDVKDIIMKSVYTRTFESEGGNQQIFSITGPDNVARGTISGFEIAGSTYFDKIGFLKDKLPTWAKGFGISANYTYIDGKQQLYKDFALPYCPAGNAASNANLFIYGCDTNGLPFRDLPLPELSRHTFNLAFMYDQGPLSARLAYNWRSRFLQAVNANSTSGTNGTSADPARAGARDVGWALPVWQEAVGQWDASMSYAFTDRFRIAFSITNLTDVITRQTQQQTMGPMPRQWFNPGRTYELTARYEF